jgi:hypothetical protein
VWVLFIYYFFSVLLVILFRIQTFFLGGSDCDFN